MSENLKEEQDIGCSEIGFFAPFLVLESVGHVRLVLMRVGRPVASLAAGPNSESLRQITVAAQVSGESAVSGETLA